VVAGLDPLTIGSLLVLASGQGGLCQMPKATQINVKPTTQKILFVTDKSLAEMQTVKTDTINPHSFSGVSITQGYAKGSIQTRAEVKLDYKTYPAQGVACIWYDTVNVYFDIDPHVYIAREVYKDRCMGPAVREHELKHVKVDRMVVNKYAHIIGQKIHQTLKDRGFIAGPVRAEDAKEVAERMQRTVMQVIEVEHKRLELDRMDMQAQVDTAEEYNRVAALCPDFKVTPEMLGDTRRKRR
jgi:hypothetical protein